MESSLRRVNPRTMALEFVSSLLGILKYVAIIFVLRFFGGRQEISPSDLIFLALGLFAFVRPLITYYSVRFGIQGESFVYVVNFLGKKEKVVPIDRVQEVEFKQPFLCQLFNVVEVRLDTASGESDEIKIVALSKEEAEALRREVLRLKQEHLPEALRATTEIPETVLWRASWADLVVAGLGSNRLFVIIGLIVTFGQQLGDARSPALARIGDWFIMMGHPIRNPFGFLFLVLSMVMVGWIVGITTTVLQFHGFTLSRSGDRLVRRSGLFTKVQRSSALTRVQAAESSSSWIQRKLGFADIKIGMAVQQEKGEAGGSEVLCPVVERVHIPKMLRMVLPELDDAPPRWQKAHPSYIWYGIWVHPLVWAILAGVASILLKQTWVWWAGLAGLVISATGAVLAHRFYAYTLQQDHLYVRQGLLRQTMTIIPLNKCLNSTIQQSYFQRRAGLGTLTVQGASTGVGSVVVVHHVPLAEAIRLHLLVSEKSYAVELSSLAPPPKLLAHEGV